MPIKFYGTGEAAIVWDGVETITGQKTFSDTIVGDISSNGTSYFTDICANSIVGDISSNGTSYFTDICANRIYSNPDAGQALIIDSSLIIPDACFNILSNGNVGIGIADPKFPMHIVLDICANEADLNGAIYPDWIDDNNNVWRVNTARSTGTGVPLTWNGSTGEPAGAVMAYMQHDDVVS